MIIISLFGLGMLGFGFFMMLKPLAFAAGIERFSQKSWFHIFEISSRAIVGLLFIYFADQAPYPKTVFIIGVILCFVSVFLLVLGEERHRRFAKITVAIGKHFRYLGVIAIVCGVALIYVGLGGGAIGELGI